MKAARLMDFLTDDEINEILLIGQYEDATDARRVVMEQILEPNMARINAALGQENSAAYLSYVIEHAMVISGAWKKHVTL